VVVAVGFVLLLFVGEELLLSLGSVREDDVVLPVSVSLILLLAERAVLLFSMILENGGSEK